MIRVLIFGVMALVIAWSGYWLIGSNSHKKSVVELLENLKQRGWVVEYSTVTVRGFPNRFDTRIENVNLSHSSGKVTWQSPWIDILLLSYNFSHVILVLPPPLEFSISDRRLSLPAQKLTASIEMSSSESFALEQLIVEIAQDETAAGEGASGANGETILAVRTHPDARNRYDISLHTMESLSGGRPSPAAGTPENLAALIPLLNIDAVAELASPVNSSSCTEQRVEVKRLEIRSAGFATETFGIEVRGNLESIDEHALQGSVHSTIRGTNELVLLFGTWLDLPKAQMMLLSLALRAMSGDSSSVDVDLAFSDTGIRIGRYLEIERFVPATLC